MSRAASRASASSRFSTRLSGLATDYCVFYSALDAVSMGFHAYLIMDACRGVDIPAGNVERSVTTMKEHNVIITHSSDLS